MVTLDIPNNLRSGKLTNTVSSIVDAVKDGDLVVVRNEGDYAVAATEAVERAKRELAAQHVNVFQCNELSYDEVLAPEIESDPLAKSKVHHHKIRFTVKLSRTPIDETAETGTQQFQKA